MGRREGKGVDSVSDMSEVAMGMIICGFIVLGVRPVVNLIQINSLVAVCEPQTEETKEKKNRLAKVLFKATNN